VCVCTLNMPVSARVCVCSVHMQAMLTSARVCVCSVHMQTMHADICTRVRVYHHLSVLPVASSTFHSRIHICYL
jgi:hypothetical protein